MNLSDITSENLIFLEQDFTTQESIYDFVAQRLLESTKISSTADFISALEYRDKIGVTGMENGLAIPHGKSSTVIEPAFAVVRLKNALSKNDWKSLDENNEVKLIFLLAIPDTDKGGDHLKILQELSTNLMDKNFVEKLMKVDSSKDFFDLLSKRKTKVEVEEINTSKNILAITACATGIAHTYMAAEALEKTAKLLGAKIHVEKQGATGIEDRISPQMIEEADGIIFATDVAPKEKERFNGLNFIQTGVSAPIKNAEQVIEKLYLNPDGVVSVSTGESSELTYHNESIGKTLMKSVMTGLSYMIPVLVAAGLMIGIGQIGASFFGLAKTISDPMMVKNPNDFVVFLHYIAITGSMIMRFMYPVFAAFMAYSIAERTGIAAGFIGGSFAAGLHYTIWGNTAGIPSGFFGALILGFVAGYTAKILNERIKLPKNLQAMKPMFIIPGISVLAVFVINYFIVDPVFGGLNGWLSHFVLQYKEAGNVILPSIIASLTAFDLGGPVNKAAGAVSIGLAADHIYPLTARVLAIVIPPIGLGLSTILDKYIVHRRVYNDELRLTGKTSLLLGFLAIGEGAIPFALANPLIVIPINMIGASFGAIIAVQLGAIQWLPLPAIWGWPLVSNFPAYAIGLLAGVIFIALANIYIRFYFIKRKE